MLKANCYIKKIGFNGANYRRDLESEMTRLLHDAAGVWVNAVLHSVNGKFPVYTGMAISSLKPIATQLGVQFSFSPVAVRKDKTPEMGEALGHDYKIQVFKNQYGAFKYAFEWNLNVPHWQENEESVGPFWLKNPGPWHSLKKANNAFNDYVRKEIPRRMPNMVNYIYTSKTEKF